MGIRQFYRHASESTSKHNAYKWVRLAACNFYRVTQLRYRGLRSRNYVRPSVTRVLSDKTKQRTTYILIPHKTAITLVFWQQQWRLVGDTHFRLKFVLKMTHPFEKLRLRQISANFSTVRDSEKVWQYEVVHGPSNEL